MKTNDEIRAAFFELIACRPERGLIPFLSTGETITMDALLYLGRHLGIISIEEFNLAADFIRAGGMVHKFFEGPPIFRYRIIEGKIEKVQIDFPPLRSNRFHDTFEQARAYLLDETMSRMAGDLDDERRRIKALKLEPAQ